MQRRQAVGLLSLFAHVRASARTEINPKAMTGRDSPRSKAYHLDIPLVGPCIQLKQIPYSNTVATFGVAAFGRPGVTLATTIIQ